MRAIDLKECHNLLLEMAEEFDRICTKYKIPYYMLGGTMLGAIRHKGFIPWDDDMDLGIPRNYYSQLIEILEKELPERYKCYTYKNCKQIGCPFAKIADCRTFTYDSEENEKNMAIGVNIDIFPLDYCNYPSKKVQDVFRWIKIFQVVYVKPLNGERLKGFIKNLIKLVFPLSKIKVTETIEKKILNLEKGTYLANLLGRWREKEIIPQEWYGECCKYKFENIELNGIKEYDLYLKKLYNNYMELPPENKRNAHNYKIYYK